MPATNVPTITPAPEPTAALAPTPLTFEQWIQTSLPDQAMIDAVEAPYARAMGMEVEGISLETSIIQGINGPFAVIIDANTATPLIISGQNAEGGWTWQEVTPGKLGAARWGMDIGINYGYALSPGVREIAARFNMQFVSYDLTWALTEPTPGQVVFQNDTGYAYPDREIQYAYEHGQKLMAGMLIASGQFPDWLTVGIENGAFAPDQVQEMVVNRITTIMQRYGDRVSTWVVVNEYHPNEWGWMVDPIQISLGNYTELAFQTARQVDPNAVLLYNDCGNETPDLGSYQFNLDLAQTLHDQGLLDGMGIQMHLLRFKDHIPTYQELLNTFNFTFR